MKNPNFLFLLVLITLIGTTFSAVPNITQINYDPNPAIPGSTITLLVQVENVDATPKQEVKVNIEDKYPFYVKEEREKLIGTIEKYGKTLVKFTIYVDSTAENKLYDIEIKVSDKSNPLGKITPKSILVSGKEPKIKVIATSEQKLVPGQEKEIEFTLQNIGTSTAYDIVLELKEDRTITASGAIIEREIMPLGAAATYIKKMNPGEETRAKINVSVNTGADLKNYILPITITYRDASGTTKTETSYVGFKVAGNVSLELAVKENPKVSLGEEKEIAIDVFNKGNGKAEFTTIEINTDCGEIIKGKEFIGNLSPNDIDSFKAKIKFNTLDECNIIVKAEYQDTDATIKAIQKTIQIKPIKSNNNEPNPIFLLIGFAIIVGIGWIIYKKFAKKHIAKK